MFEPTARTSSKTMEHLPAFLLGGDRRHQWIAAAVVCTIAASVLLLTGRSSMTDPVIEQSHKSLTPEGESDFQPPFAPRDEGDDRAPNIPAQAELGQGASSHAASSPATAAAPPPGSSSEPAPPSQPSPPLVAPETRPAPAQRPTPVQAPRAAPPAPARAAPDRAAPARAAAAPAAQPARTAPAASEPSKARPAAPAAPRPSAPATTPKAGTTGSRSGGDPGEFDFGF